MSGSSGCFGGDLSIPGFSIFFLCSAIERRPYIAVHQLTVASCIFWGSCYSEDEFYHCLLHPIYIHTVSSSHSLHPPPPKLTFYVPAYPTLSLSTLDFSTSRLTVGTYHTVLRPSLGARARGFWAPPTFYSLSGILTSVSKTWMCIGIAWRTC